MSKVPPPNLMIRVQSWDLHGGKSGLPQVVLNTHALTHTPTKQTNTNVRKRVCLGFVETTYP